MIQNAFFFIMKKNEFIVKNEKRIFFCVGFVFVPPLAFLKLEGIFNAEESFSII